MKTYIKNAWICDGSGAKIYHGGILFDEQKILALYHGEPEQSVDADRTIDAAGKWVTPGFVDIHRHCDALPFRGASYGDAMLRQGITTTVVGNCGISLTPAPADEKEAAGMYRYYEAVLGPVDERLSVRPKTFTDYMKALEQHTLPVHTAAMIGTGAVRISVKGFSDTPYTQEELDQARERIEEAMKEGAPGVSLGIMYLPECYSHIDEFAYILEPVGRYGRVITTHIRGEGDSLVKSVQEVIEIASKAGCALEISHFKSCGMKNWGREIYRAIGLIEEARSRGMDVTCDFYPYDGGSTALTTMLPPDFVAGDLDKALLRLGDEKSVEELRLSLEQEHPGWDNYAISLGWDRILISGVTCPEYRKMLGLNMEEAARQYGYRDAVALAAEMMHREDGRTAIINLSMSQDDIDEIAKLPYSILISDSIYADTDTPHPRLYGAFPKFLREYAAEKKLLSLEEAVRKMTQMPAQRMALKGKGLLKEGMDADILIFDPTVFRDNATYQDPARLASGLDTVFLNGQIALREDKVLKYDLGQVIRV